VAVIDEWCFKGVMVRLMLVLAPVMCILSGIAVSSTLTTYMKNLDVVHKDKKKKTDATYPAKNEVLSRDVTEPSNIRICGFHVQNPSDLDADTDLSHNQNYELLWLLYCTIQLLFT